MDYLDIPDEEIREWYRSSLNLLSSDLQDLGANRTDKGDQYHSFRGLSYLNIYDFYFRSIKNKAINLLEIGVSGDHSKDQCSLWVWKDYFPNARVFGLDIDPKCKRYERPGIKIFIGNQNSQEVLQNISNTVDYFDIIIDDGSHVNKHIISSFSILINKIRKGGFYCIEDMGCSYGRIEDWGCRQWPGMSLNDPDEDLNNDRSVMDLFFGNLIRQMDTRTGDILGVHFWSQMCVIIK